jgi:hypothetical protein
MKTTMLVLTFVLLSGCAPLDKMNVVRETVDTGRIQGMDKETKFSSAIGIPGGATHPGPYSSVDYINVEVETGKYMGKNATFFFGKSREMDKWEVFRVMVEEDGKWRVIPLCSDGKE